ncbi:MAG: HEAT repeat domain-containing protein [Clostridia bacterium]|nr:HEAT repeat domain-containing protein [Clostridia bacterium]
MTLLKHSLNDGLTLDKDKLVRLARETLSDRERCSCLGILALKGDLVAAEELLEMEAILGELTSLGKEVGNVIGQYFLNHDLELVENILAQGNLPKLRCIIRHLNRLQGDGLMSGLRTPGEKVREIDNFLNALAYKVANYLKDDNPACRLGAIEILAICPMVKGEWLTLAIQDRHLYVRAKALRLVSASLEKGRPRLEKTPEELGKMVVKGIQDSSPLVREKAVYCLAGLDLPEKLDYLYSIALSNQEVVRVRLAAIQALTLLLGPEEIAMFLYRLRDTDRFPIRLFVRELLCEMGRGEEAEEHDLLWGSYYSFWGNDGYRNLDNLLLRWMQLFCGDTYEPSEEEEIILEQLRTMGSVEEVLRQVLDFYLEMEERFFTTGLKDVTKIQRFKEILKIFGEKEIIILGQILAVEKDLSLRLSAIEALSELALDGIKTTRIQEILLNHLNRTTNPPDQERVLSVLYVFPRESYLGSVLPHLSSRSLKVMVQAASVLASFDAKQVSCYNVQRIVWQIFNNVRRRRIFGKLWGDMALYTARIRIHDHCDTDVLAPYLNDDDYLVRRFAREVAHYIGSFS